MLYHPDEIAHLLHSWAEALASGRGSQAQVTRCGPGGWATIGKCA
ncbi:hypothetical protein [Deinococcus caeni]